MEKGLAEHLREGDYVAFCSEDNSSQEDYEPDKMLKSRRLTYNGKKVRLTRDAEIFETNQSRYVFLYVIDPRTKREASFSCHFFQLAN